MLKEYSRMQTTAPEAADSLFSETVPSRNPNKDDGWYSSICTVLNENRELRLAEDRFSPA